jgi:hypothetical protein
MFHRDLARSEERTKVKEQRDLSVLYQGMGKGMLMNVVCYYATPVLTIRDPLAFCYVQHFE